MVGPTFRAMSTHPVLRVLLGATLTTAGAAGAVGLATTPASAATPVATISINNGVVKYVGTTAANDVAVDLYDPTVIEFVEAEPGTIKSGPGCFQESPQEVNCLWPTGKRISVALGGGADTATIDTYHREDVTLTIDGGAGDDVIDASGSWDPGVLNLRGGAGDDTLRPTISWLSSLDVQGGADEDTVLLDHITTEEAFDELFGASISLDDDANDTPPYSPYWQGGTANFHSDIEALQGTQSDDRLVGNAKDNRFLDSPGADTYIGYTGIDTVDYSTRAPELGGVDVSIDGVADDGGPIDVEDGHSDNVTLTIENVVGTNEGDTLEGSFLANHISGGEGYDNISGGGGADTLEGWTEPDTIDGGSGADTIDGGPGGDDVDGGDDDDTVIGGNLSWYDGGKDRLAGGEGDDTVIGNDKGWMSSEDPDPYFEFLYGGPGDDDLLGGVGPSLLAGGEGADLLNGGDGLDTSTYAGRSDDIVVKIDGTANDGAPGEKDNVKTENVLGGHGDDTLIGSAGPNVLVGGLSAHIHSIDHGEDHLDGKGGNDTLIGGDAHDVLVGGGGHDMLTGDGDPMGMAEPGDDSLNGGGGNDTLDGQEGDDTLLGGSGTDLADYSTRTEPVRVTLDGAANDGEPGISEHDNVATEGVRGGSAADELTGDTAANTLYGGTGADLLNGLAGNDKLYGEVDHDILDGGTGADVVDGGDGIDLATYASRTAAVSVRLDHKANDGVASEGDNVIAEAVTGGAGDDRIAGDDADNVLRGGAGADSLFGYDGNDFLYGDAGYDTDLLGGGGYDTCTRGADGAAYADCESVTDPP